MKNSFFFFVFFCFLSSILSAQESKIQKVKSEIENATLYLNGAELVQKAKINLPQGRTTLVFENISAKIDASGIRITTGNDVDILSISSQINYLTKEEDLPQIKALKDSLLLVQTNETALDDELNAWTSQKDLLLKNNQIGGQNTGVSIADLKSAADFFQTRIKDINTRISAIGREKLKYETGLTRIQNELYELNAQAGYSRAVISILVSAEKATATDIELKYPVSDAGWSPVYDIKAEDSDKPVELIYRGQVFNNTGIEWKNVKLKLSTADPTRSVTQPALNPWYLNYTVYNNFKGQSDISINSEEGYTQNAIISMDEMQKESNVAGSPVGGNNQAVVNLFNEAAVPELSAEFEIDKTYSVPSDDKPYLVDISKHSLPAEFEHFAVTKLDRDVFLLAKISGWEDLNLVDGPANVYYAGTYLGQSFITTRNVKDTLDLSLGRDGKVLVTRTKLQNMSSTQFIGNKRKETVTYELIAKNNRKSPINIVIIDQIPISQNEEIEVKALEISGAEQNPLTGELKWKMTLQPGESKKLELSFYIKYPKNKPIEIEQKKSMKVRYFK
jgi:uncharacterized protein (TIGR02231 family)